MELRLIRTTFDKSTGAVKVHIVQNQGQPRFKAEAWRKNRKT